MNPNLMSLLVCSVVLSCTMPKEEIYYYPFKAYGRWGVFDSHGDVKVPPQFDTISSFYEGRAFFYQNGKCGYINPSGKIIIENKYSWCTCFNDGVATLSLGEDNENMKYLIIDTLGKAFFTSSIDSFDNISFNNLFGSSLTIDDNINFIDKFGNVKIHTNYNIGLPFSEGLEHVWKFRESKKIGISA